MIGMKFKLLYPMLGNPAETEGYVFNQYEDFDDPEEYGIQIIFPNGEYDGFSAREQHLYLKYVCACPEYSDYNFRNVMQVSEDFRKGYWKWLNNCLVLE
jgi:hypothetical protein